MAQVSTGLSKLTARQAAVVSLAAVALMAWGIAAVRGGAPEPKNTTQQSDGKTYQKVVIRLRTGQPYYEALGRELRAGAYPTKSIFNWRTPLHLTAVAAIGEPASRYLLAILAAAALILAGIATSRGGGPGPVQSFAMLVALSECFIFEASFHFHLIGEVWAGVLIIISLAAYSLDCWPAGVGAGILALFLRELALPFVVVNWLIAFRRRNWREFYAWTGGLLGWAFYFLMHARAAMSHMNGHDLALHGGPVRFLPWIEFGGPRFLVETMRMSLLVALPAWASAVLLPIVLLGAAGWVTGIGRRVGAVVAIYIVAFTIAGLKVDLFWGAITNPVLTFGLVWSVPAIRDLVRALSRSRSGLNGEVNESPSPSV